MKIIYKFDTLHIFYFFKSQIIQYDEIRSSVTATIMKLTLLVLRFYCIICSVQKGLRGSPSKASIFAHMSLLFGYKKVALLWNCAVMTMTMFNTFIVHIKEVSISCISSKIQKINVTLMLPCMLCDTSNVILREQGRFGLGMTLFPRDYIGCHCSWGVTSWTCRPAHRAAFIIWHDTPTPSLFYIKKLKTLQHTWQWRQHLFILHLICHPGP